MIGDRLKKLRAIRGLSQEELSKHLGLSRGTYAHYEINKRQPDYGTLKKLSDFFNVSLDYLISGEESSNVESKLPSLSPKDEKDIAKKLESIIDSMDSDTALSFNGEPMDDETKDLVRAAIESNLMLTKQLAKKKFTPKQFRKE